MRPPASMCDRILHRFELKSSACAETEGFARFRSDQDPCSGTARLLITLLALQDDRAHHERQLFSYAPPLDLNGSHSTAPARHSGFHGEHAVAMPLQRDSVDSILMDLRGLRGLECAT